jgi:geranylgeranylglycerol-phosphate geranylgeranyltransferase
MCTFIVNDLDDIDKDLINHPNRPLPSGVLSPTFVTVFYFAALAAALFTTRYCIADARVASVYYIGIALAISYGYVVDYLPTLKPAYVAGTSITPVIVLTLMYPAEALLPRACGAVFLAVLGRELCKDILDRPGDPLSRLHAVNERKIALVAFALQGIAIAFVGVNRWTPLTAAATAIMSLLMSRAAYLWFASTHKTASLAVMKGVIYCGLILIVPPQQ